MIIFISKSVCGSKIPRNLLVYLFNLASLAEEVKDVAENVKDKVISHGCNKLSCDMHYHKEE